MAKNAIFRSRIRVIRFFIDILGIQFFVESPNLCQIVSIAGSFEVQINNTLIHSKISRAAFPDNDDVVRNVQLASNGQPVEKAKEQPITDCVIQ